MNKFIIVFFLKSILLFADSQETRGDKSPVINTKGNVTINYSVKKIDKIEYRYEVYKKGDNVIKYPQVTNIENHILKQKINEKIKDHSGLYDFPTDIDEFNVESEVVYESSNYLEIFFEIFTYSHGAAHPVTYLNSLVINVNNGSVYQLKDLFRTGYEVKLTGFIQKYLNKKDYDLHDCGDWTSSEKEILGNKCYYKLSGNEAFSYNGKYLYLYFGQCDLTACYAGEHKIKIKLKDIKEIINPNGPLEFYL